jgi:hypothetical protein
MPPLKCYDCKFDLSDRTFYQFRGTYYCGTECLHNVIHSLDYYGYGRVDIISAFRKNNYKCLTCDKIYEIRKYHQNNEEFCSTLCIYKRPQKYICNGEKFNSIKEIYDRPRKYTYNQIINMLAIILAIICIIWSIYGQYMIILKIETYK